MTTSSGSPSRTIARYSEDAFLISCHSEAPADLLLSIDAALGRTVEGHCGEQTVLVRFDPSQTNADHLCASLRALRPDSRHLKSEHLTLRIRYDGPDLEHVASAANLTVEQVVALHSAPTYRVAFAGFSPGFAYLTGLPAELQLPRRSSPRPKVPAGSLAIAAHYCAIYPSTSPGGWHLLGTSNAELFNPNRNPPALLRPGTSIKFEAVQ